MIAETFSRQPQPRCSPTFAEQVLAFVALAAGQYGQVVVHRDRVGAPIDGFDAQIASICRSRDATLATRTVGDFTDTGINVIDPGRAAD